MTSYEIGGESDIGTIDEKLGKEDIE